MSEYRKTDDTLISVIVPVYKVEQYLEKCVNSISVQTYSNLEIILVDDIVAGGLFLCPVNGNAVPYLVLHNEHT